MIIYNFSFNNLIDKILFKDILYYLKKDLKFDSSNNCCKMKQRYNALDIKATVTELQKQ